MARNFIYCDGCGAKLPANRGSYPNITVEGHEDAFLCRDCERQEGGLTPKDNIAKRILRFFAFWNWD